MADPVEIVGEHLKILGRIEDLLKKSVPGAGNTFGGRSGGNQTARNQAATGGRNGADAKTFKATNASIEGLGDTAEDVDKRLQRLGKTVSITTGRFGQLNQSMRVFARTQPGVATKTPNNSAAGGGGGGIGGLFGKMFGGGGGKGSPGSLSKEFQILDGTVTSTRVGLLAMFNQLKGAVLPLVDDIFELQKRGISASSSLAGLYVDAAKAGMSLGEYTALLEKSGPAVVRAASFDDFAKTIQRSNDQLAGLGVFGAEASKLSATLATSATTLGVPQAQLGDAMSKQIDVFNDLRKTTMITADQFEALTADLANNQEVQSQLIGLQGQERANAFADLQRTQTLGLQMGATAQASKALGDALLAQRKLTVQQRFQAAGTIRQAGAITGLGADDTETLAQLSRKKNRTADENAQFTQLGARLQAQIEAMQNTGNPNDEFIAEQLQERLNQAGIGDQLQKAANANLTAQSGPVINKEINERTGAILQNTGKMLSLLEGINKNTIASSLIAAVGSGVASAVATSAFKNLLGRLPIFGGAGRAAGAAAEGGGIIGGAKNLLGGTWNAIKGSVTAIDDLLTRAFKIGPGSGIFADIKAVAVGIGDGFKFLWNAVTDIKGTAYSIGKGLGTVVNWIEDAFGAAKTGFSKAFGFFADTVSAVRAGVTEAGGFIKILGEFGGTLLKAFGKIAAFSNVFSFFIDAIGEAFTGNIAAAFNDDGGSWVDRIGNVIFAGLNGLFGGIFSLVDDAIKFFGGEGLNLENAWDKFAVVMKAGFFAALASIAKAVTFGSDNKLSNYFQEAADNSFKVLDKLSDDSTATIGSIGKKRNDQLKAEGKQADDTKTKADAALGSMAKIQTSTIGLAASAISQASTIATPGATPVNGVTPPDVNTTTTNATGTPAVPGTTDTTALGTTQTPQQQLAQNIATIIDLLRKSLDQETLQVESAQAMAAALSRNRFPDTVAGVDRIVGRTAYMAS